MRALVCKEFGPPDSLVIEEVDDPTPDKGQVVVDVHAAGINFPDILMFAGKYQVRMEPPFIGGLELCGVVSELGDGVAHLAIGDKVIVTPLGGGFAERIAVDGSQVLPLPEMLSFEQGAGFPITYCTSYHAFKQCTQLQSGETLLVLGAAGGVGTTAVEIGKAMGAHVIAAASNDDKLAFARSVGADESVNYTSQSLKEAVKELTGGKGVDVVYDPVGGELSDQALRATAWHGRYLVVGFASGEIPKFPANLALLKEASIIGVFWGQWAAKNPEVHLANFDEMVGLLKEGKLSPRITAVYDLDDYKNAYQDVAGRRITGKTVFKMR